MQFSEYQRESRKTNLGVIIGAPCVYPVLGLMNEAGELAGKVKKMFRDDHGELTEERKESIKQELGDVLWYLSQTATEFNLSLDEVAQSNLEKLFSRKERGTLQGSGDAR